MNKVFIKENALEQVKSSFLEISNLRGKFKQDISLLEERHSKELADQEIMFLREIEDYKKIIENLNKQQCQQTVVLENSNENSRVLLLKQLVSRIENLESKHKIREMELERELNETKYR